MDIGKIARRTKEVFDFCKSFRCSRGYIPSYKEIGKGVGLSSSSSVHRHMSLLEKAGLITRQPGCPRAIDYKQESNAVSLLQSWLELSDSAPRELVLATRQAIALAKGVA